MKSLITPAQVVATAFGDSEYIAPEVIVEADIAAACHHYITPIIGPTLLEALLDGRYPALLDNYVAPALAFAVRCSIQPSLNVRTCEQGLSLPAGGGSASTTAAAEALVASLRHRCRILRSLLSDHLATHAADYPEYNPNNDSMKNCTIYGGIVQIH
jgi:hypothetical protein